METRRNLAEYIDAAVLAPALSREEAGAQIRTAIDCGCKTVCVMPWLLELAAQMCQGHATRPSVVLGFPHGSQETAVKVFEARQLMRFHPAEVDMVNNIGLLRGGQWDLYEAEIRAVGEVVHAGGARLKVILETSQLTRDEIMDATRACIRAGADFVKTSTGYGTKGCTIQDLQLMRRSVSERVQVKGSGGIRDLDTVLSARAVGATRCGVSATAAIMAEAEKRYAEGTLQEVDTLKEMEGGY